MSFFPHAAYKESGIEWLGKIPMHWLVTSLKRVAVFQTGWTPPTGREDLYGGPHPWVTIGDLGGRYVSDSSKQITDEAIQLAGLEPSPKGSLLFSFKLSIGQVAFAERDLYTNEAIATFLEEGKIDLSFAYYALPVDVVQNAAENIYGAKLLNQELIRNATVALPPAQEQSAIASFLDRETGKIDALVAEQERLIALLKEKRQAVISQAVTKGLDPNVKMKNSGVEWLGDVPAHWEVQRLSRRCGFTSGKAHEPFIDLDGDYVCVTARFISTNGVEERRCTQNLTPANVGDILMVMSDLPNGRALARAFLVKEDSKYAVNQRVCAIAPLKDDSKFLSFQLDRSQWLLSNDDGVNQTHLSNDDFRKLPLLLPPVEEQQRIATFLDETTTKFIELIAEAEHAILLFRERRAALISAAVTGKIDVRYQAATEQAAA